MKTEGNIVIVKESLSNADKKFLAKTLRRVFDSPISSEAECAKIVNFFQKHQLPGHEELARDFEVTFNDWTP